VHRIYCTRCGMQSYEQLDFLPYPKARVTRSLARTLLELRSSMSLSAICRYYHIDWDTLKALEISALEKKYRHIRLKDVRVMGIDEIHVGHERVDGKRRQKYLTIVRDLVSGAVLFVGDGKGCEALAPFNRRIRQFRANIDAICMDMSNAYTKWVNAQFPNATVVYDHFHVIKLVNEKLDQIRRNVQNDLDEQNRKELKGKRWRLLGNRENLNEDDRLFMEQLRTISKELHDAWVLKEQLRSIFKVADNADDAKAMLMQWADICQRTECKPMATLGRTILRHMDGICAYWTQNGLTNAAMEGFNNKVRHMFSQAYGFHDYNYVKLKIHELPSMEIKTQLLSSCS